MNLLSVGHSNRSLDGLIALLSEHGVRTLVDVRSRPASRRMPWFARAALEPALARAGIRYLWEGRDLGGLRATAPGDERHCALSTPGFRAYAWHMGTPGFAAAVERLILEALEVPTAFMCAERDPAECHRSLLADLLVHRGGAVEHLLGPGISRPHRLSPGFRMHAGAPRYDRLSQRELDL